jgi:UDP-glucose 4-epimerase
MTKCLILGGNGFIGSHLADALHIEGYELVIFDHFKRGSRNFKNISNEITLHTGDFSNKESLTSALIDVDYVFHYISTTTPASAFANPVYDIESNVINSIKLLQYSVEAGVKKFIFPSSGGTIYGEPTCIPINESAPVNPTNPYAISKFSIEKYIQYFNKTYGLDYLILRYSNPYGERQSPYGDQGVIPIFLNKIRNNEKPKIYGDGSSIRDYIYIQDAVDATLSLLEIKKPDNIFNIGSGQGFSLNQLIDLMSLVCERSIEPEYIQSEQKYISKIVLDISKIQRVAKWNPKVDLLTGLKQTWNWINSEI